MMSGWFSRKKKKKKRTSTSDDWYEMQRMSMHFKEEEMRLHAQRVRIDKKKAWLESLGITIDESTSEPDAQVHPFKYEDPGDRDMKQMMMQMKLKFEEEKLKLDRLEKELDRIEKAYDGALEEFD